MSFQAKSYSEALERANSKPQKARKPLSRGNGFSKPSSMPSLGQNRPVRRRVGKQGNPPTGPFPAKRGLSSAKRPMNKRGPATRAWDIARAWLDRQFKKAGISACQFRFKGCWGASAVHYAHPAKRRHLKEGELYVAAKSCDPCHNILDDRSKTSIEEMRALVEAAFNSTGIQRKVVE